MRAVPFCVRIRSLLQEANIALRDIARASHTRLPPWQLVTPVTDLSLSDMQKSAVLPAELNSKALELISSFTDRQHLYTDGSKSDAGVGCAFVCGSATRTFTLSPTPQGDRPLPAPREAGPWAPAFGGAGLGRLGEWRPPGPSRFRFRFFLFFLLHFSLLLCGTVEPCD